MCSLLGKVDEVRKLMIHTPFDILTLSQTWLTEDILDCEISLPGYSSVRKDRRVGRGGGVITYIKHGLTFSEREDLNNDIDEVLWIEINRSNFKPVLVATTYHAPDCALDDFLHRVEQSLSQVESKRYEKVILGDFNVNFNFSRKKPDQQLKRKLSRVIAMFDMHQLICTPTRITYHSETIDLVFVNNKHRITEAGVLHLGLSDHSLIYCTMKSSFKSNPKTVEYRSFKCYSKNAFINVFLKCCGQFWMDLRI